jgi:hypothetical protein
MWDIPHSIVKDLFSIGIQSIYEYMGQNFQIFFLTYQKLYVMKKKNPNKKKLQNLINALLTF